MPHSSERPTEVVERIGEVLEAMRPGEGLVLGFPAGPKKMRSDVMVSRGGSRQTPDKEGVFTWFVK